MKTETTRVERPITGKTTKLEIENNDLKEQDISKLSLLKRWLNVIKLHTLDGTVLALIDEALSGRKPLGGDYIKDNSHESHEL